jgi:hypothetical protein
MPIPERRKDEEEQAFVSRCMGDKVMVKDYPDQKQRAAICYRQAKIKKDSKAESKNHLNIKASVEFFDLEAGAENS